MRCSNCQSENPPGMKFCGQCGARLAQACPACGRENPPDNRFCGYCGSPLSSAATPVTTTDGAIHIGIPADAVPSGPFAPHGAERRQLTVMFCDLVGSTRLSSTLDAEELRDVVAAYQAVCAGAIEANEGYIAQYLGDGVLAYFGYPRSTEREASRAVRAGLAVVRGVRRLGERLQKERGLGVAVRVGIHTGVVVIGEIGAGQRRENLALGETPNLAARLQSLAEPNTVVVSGETQRLLGGEFECEDLGTRTVAGIPAPVQLCRITRDLAGELAAARRSRHEPIVGRELELAFLHGRWERVREGSGQVVLVSGDSGLGKSSLMHAFAAAVGDEAVLLETRCLPYFQSTAYQPVVELLQYALGCPASEPPERKLHCLGDLLERQGLPLGEMMPIFASVLSLPYEQGEAPEGETPQQRKERTRTALLQLLLGAAAGGPLLLCVEDLHWADPSTLELLTLLVRQLPTERILALFSHRPDFLPPWGHPAHQSQLSLTRLQEADVEAIIARLAGGKALPPEVHAQILARTDGVPLFVEELTKTVLESGLLRDAGPRYELVGGMLPPLAIPATLHDSLEARLDRLAATKELAQLGAVLGREFSYELVRAVSDAGEAELREALAQLVSAELLYQRGVPPKADFTFKHALIQEAAYQSLLKGVRQTWHLRAARALEERFPDEAAAHPERVAQHYTAAGLPGPAIDAWVRAGRRAVERSANHEAVAHLRQGLELLDDLEAGPERDGRELALLVTLGPALVATEGHAASEVRDTYLRALELSRALGVEDEHLEIMGGLFSFYFVRSEIAEAFELAREMLRSAAEDRHPEWEGPALVAIGVALLKAGTLHESRDHLERGLRLYDPARHFALAHAIGQDFGVVAWCYSGFVHFALGFPDEALERVRRAAELARELSHPHSLAMALSFNVTLHFFRREPEAALTLLAEVEELTAREGFRHWGMDVPPMRAWALAAQGRLEEALAAAGTVNAEGLVAGRGMGPALYRARVLAEAYLGAGRPELAEPILERLEAAVAAEAPEMWWVSEVFRTRAAALAQLGRTDEARTRLERAVETARAAGTPLLLLRALVDLARLRGTLDRELRAALEEACRALAEAGEVEEVCQARALLETPGPEAELVGA